MTKLFIDDAGWLQSVEVIQSPNLMPGQPTAKLNWWLCMAISYHRVNTVAGHIKDLFCNNLDVDAHEYFDSICEWKSQPIAWSSGMVKYYNSSHSWIAPGTRVSRSGWASRPCNDFSIGNRARGLRWSGLYRGSRTHFYMDYILLYFLVQTHTLGWWDFLKEAFESIKFQSHL